MSAEQRERKVAVFSAGAAVAVLALGAALGHRLAGGPASVSGTVAIALLLAIAVASENKSDGSSFSAATAPTVALAVLAGPLVGVGAMVALTVAVDARGGYRRSERAAAASTMAFLTASMWLAYVAAVSLLEPLGSTWAAVGGGALAGAAGWIASVAPSSWQQSESAGSAVRRMVDAHAWVAPHEVLMGLTGGGLVLGYDAWGLAGIVIFAVPVVGSSLAIGQYTARTAKDAQRVREANTELRAANANLERLLAENHELLDAKQQQYLAVIQGFALAIDRKDRNTAQHTERSSHVAELLAMEIGLDDTSKEYLRQGALLHDIGKIGVRDAVLHKPGGLTDAEWAEIRRHPEIAGEILEQLDLPETVRHVIVHHHENVDGTGYPNGLTADDLPIETRIMRVADSYDAMTKARAYRSAMPVHAAIAELRRCAGTQFCPVVVAAMERLYRAGLLDRYERSVEAAD